MPIERCPACGYRNRQRARQCMNCGKAIVEPVPERSAVLERPVIRPAARKESRAPVIVVHQVQDKISPYGITYQDRALDIAPFEESLAALPASGRLVDEWQPPSRLPFAFSLFKPRLAGKIIHIEAREQINDFPNFAAALFAILGEIVWVIPNVPAAREPNDRVEVTKLRIQTSEGLAHDAIMRGGQRGANLSMGDYVSLWGYRRKGHLVIRKGYDHTTRSAISTTAVGALLPALLILLVVAMLYLHLAHLTLADVFEKFKDLLGWAEHKLLPFLHK